MSESREPNWSLARDIESLTSLSWTQKSDAGRTWRRGLNP